MPGFGSLAQTPDEPYPEEGAGMPETYQSPAGRAIANLGVGLAKAVWDIPRKLGQAAEVPAGLRREDVTDIPVRHGITGTAQFGAEPQDELVEGTTGSAINRIGTGLPFAPRGAGVFGGKLAKPVEAVQSEVPHQSPYVGWHEAMEGIKAYHGSPHDFDKFDISKIGTGEGAQAYGHGLYFAENPTVAQNYKLAGQPGYISPVTQGAARVAMDEAGGDINKARDILHRKYLDAVASKDHTSARNYQDAGNNIDTLLNHTPGKMYEVNIKADPEHFLDWDKPLSEQPQAALATRRAAQDVKGWSGNPTDTPQSYIENLSSRLMDQGMSAAEAKAAAAARLREAGIPGIKYLDQGSRPPTQFELDRAKSLLAGAEMNGDPAWIAKQKDNVARLEALMAKPPTRNYVVFDDKLIDILRKYGWAGLVGSAGLLGGKDSSKEM